MWFCQSRSTLKEVSNYSDWTRHKGCARCLYPIFNNDGIIFNKGKLSVYNLDMDVKGSSKMKDILTKKILLCKNCGHVLFKTIVFRQISTSVWYKPWTWGTWEFEWKSDSVI